MAAVHRLDVIKQEHVSFGTRIIGATSPLLRCLWVPFTVARISGVPIQFHSTGVIVPSVLITQVSPIYPVGEVILVSSLNFALFYLSVLVHELGHVWVARCAFGIQTRKVIILPIGGVALLKSAPRGKAEFWIAFAGPLANLVAAGALWLISLGIDDSSSFWMRRIGGVLAGVSQLNLFVAAVNLLPCHPLDGGRMLRAALALFYHHRRGLPPHQAGLLATRVAVRYVAWFVFAGVMVFTTLNPGYWLEALLLLIALLLGEGDYWLLRTEPNDRFEEPSL